MFCCYSVTFLHCSFAVSTGRPNLPSLGSSGAFTENGPTVTRKFDQLVRKKVRCSWPEDNDLYEASHCDYNPREVFSNLLQMSFY